MSYQATLEEKIEIDRLPLRRALLSVSDKSGLDALAKMLADIGCELYSTGGTESYLRNAGFAVRPITDLTDFPEMLDGRVKTLHPVVHGGLLYRRELQSHVRQAEEHGIGGIDLLVVNLYPFEQTVAKIGATQEEIIENIDIGGPAMLRSAGKNFAGVALLTDPHQYEGVITELRDNSGTLGLTTRRNLAAQAFDLVARYDVAIAKYFHTLTSPVAEASTLPGRLRIDLPMAQPLRYGENPQQKAALYGEDFGKIFTQLWGKELSYNNILDTSAAVQLIAEFTGDQQTVVAIIKHTNPCGVAEGSDPLDAFNRAFSSDPESPFGGIIIANRPIDAPLAARLNEFFSEVVLAPEFTAEALETLKKKKDRRLLTYNPTELQRVCGAMLELRAVAGGVLMQESDRDLIAASSLESVTARKPSADEMRGLIFSWKIVKHVKSNAIVYAGLDGGFAKTLGIGAGQTSRVQSSRIAVERAKMFGQSLAGSLVASDAFFPFADGLVEAAKAGAVAAIQPGGSVRDNEVIAAAEEHNVALVMTGMRHFKH